MFAFFLVEPLDDLHRRQHFGDHCPDIGDAVLAGARDLAQAPPEQRDRDNDGGDQQEQPHGQAGDQPEQIGRAPDRHQRIAQRDRDSGADHLFDQRGVAGHAAGNFLGTVLFIEPRRQAQQVFLHAQADVGDHALAQPADEIEPHRSARGKHGDDHQQIAEPAAHVLGRRPFGKAAVDHHLEARGDRQRRRRSDEQREDGERDMAGIARARLPYHAQ